MFAAILRASSALGFMMVALPCTPCADQEALETSRLNPVFRAKQNSGGLDRPGGVSQSGAGCPLVHQPVSATAEPPPLRKCARAFRDCFLLAPQEPCVWTFDAGRSS